MKKIMIMLMTILLGSICLTSKISAATTFYPSSCELEIDGDNLKIVCDEAVFNKTGRFSYNLMVDATYDTTGRLMSGVRFNLNTGVTASSDARELSFTIDTYSFPIFSPSFYMQIHLKKYISEQVLTILVNICNYSIMKIP